MELTIIHEVVDIFSEQYKEHINSVMPLPQNNYNMVKFFPACIFTELEDTWSALASVVTILVIFPEEKFLRPSCVSLKDLQKIAATYN